MTTERTCTKCGCTSKNCAGCIARTGAPCWWVDDRCSACCDPADAYFQLTTQLASGALSSFRQPGAIVAILGRNNSLYIGGASMPAATMRIAEIAAAFAAVGQDLAAGDIVRCAHCNDGVARRTDVDAIRRHSTTCPSSPVVRELAAAKSRIAQLEVELADARSDREVVTLGEPVWSPAPKEG